MKADNVRIGYQKKHNKMPSKKAIIQFFLNFDLTREIAKSISIERYCIVVETAERWYGIRFAQYVQDRFVQTGNGTTFLYTGTD